MNSNNIYIYKQEVENEEEEMYNIIVIFNF
jgi:hypothetical protein